MAVLGSNAPAFALPDPTGRIHTLHEFDASTLLLVAFICNHCPYVLHILDSLVRYAADYASGRVATVAISVNDVAAYPEDGPQQMSKLARDRHFGFPYLYDESQRSAIAFGAMCTPDFFLYDRQRRLAYRGRFDGSRPSKPGTAKPVPVTGADLRAATDALLAGLPVPSEQLPSIGCSLKWKPGNDPG